MEEQGEGLDELWGDELWGEDLEGRIVKVENALHGLPGLGSAFSEHVKDKMISPGLVHEVTSI